mgnify:CR=1 FL=1
MRRGASSTWSLTKHWSSIAEPDHPPTRREAWCARGELSLTSRWALVEALLVAWGQSSRSGMNAQTAWLSTQARTPRTPRSYSAPRPSP